MPKTKNYPRTVVIIFVAFLVASNVNCALYAKTSTSQQLLDMARRVQFTVPVLSPYEAVYDIKEKQKASDQSAATQENLIEKTSNTSESKTKNTEENGKEKGEAKKRDHVLGGEVRVTLERHQDFWHYTEEGTYQLMKAKGGMTPCKWTYTFKEDKDSAWLRFSYQRFEGDTLIQEHAGKAIFDPIQQKFTLVWEKPFEDTIVLGRRVFFPLAFRRHLFHLLDQKTGSKPVFVNAYVFTGKETVLLSARECLINTPTLLTYKTHPKGRSGEPLLGWSIRCAFYKEKQPGETLMPHWCGNITAAENGLPLSYDMLLGEQTLSCDYRPGSVRFLEGSK